MKVVFLRVSDEQHGELKADAEMQGLSINELAIERIFGRTETEEERWERLANKRGNDDHTTRRGNAGR